MQDAKDSFYEMLRARLGTLNPERTVVLRGVTRPGVLVDENEAVSATNLPGCFHLRWTAMEWKTEGAVPIAMATCEVAYCSAGSPEMGGLDRGRVLATMDFEVGAALRQAPLNIIEQCYDLPGKTGVPQATTTRLWWSDPVFGAAITDGDRLSRIVQVRVMCLEEGLVD